MSKSAVFICFLLSITVAYGQYRPLALRKLSTSTFDSAKMRKTVGIEEAGRIHFKFAKGTSLTHGESGSNGYTWFSVIEKTGRLLITDSVKAAGILLKLNGMENDIELKSTLYRNVGGKVKKADLDENSLQITEKGDTTFYAIGLQSAQTNDILQLSYTITSKIIYTSRWLMINEISPGTISRLDIYTPSYLEYKIAFKGFKAEQIKSSSEETEQIITFERKRSFIPTKGSSELASVTAKVGHGTYAFNSRSKLKFIVATLVQETLVE